MAVETLTEVYYASDVEGNFEYFRRFIDLSPGMSFSKCRTFLQLEDNIGFVFGGDLYDKGSYDIRLSKLLCDLKDKYPNRVWLLMGNRDVNKLRFSSELHITELDHIHDDPPFWDQKALGFISWLSKNNLERNLVSKLKYTLECSMGALNTFENRRKELFEIKHKIGFLYEKESEESDNRSHIPSSLTSTLTSLSSTSGQPPPLPPPITTLPSIYDNMFNEISDEDVLKSFQDSVTPQGFVTQFLSRAQIGARVGDTVFVHGAITLKSLLYVPSNDLLHRHYHGRPSPGYYLDSNNTNIDLWFEKLNEFKDNSIQDFIQRPFWEDNHKKTNSSDINNNENENDDKDKNLNVDNHYDYFRRRGGEALLGYHSGKSSNKCNIIVESFLTFSDLASEFVAPIDQKVFKYLKSSTSNSSTSSQTKEQEQGINRIIVGHQPVGVSPLIVKYNKHGLPLTFKDHLKHDDNQDEEEQEEEDDDDDYIEVVCADTSFSHNNFGFSDTRGIAAFSLKLSFRSHASSSSSSSSSSLLSSSSSSTSSSSSSSSSLCTTTTTSYMPSNLSISGTLPDGKSMHIETSHNLIGRYTKNHYWICGYKEIDNENENHDDQSIEVMSNKRQKILNPTDNNDMMQQNNKNLSIKKVKENEDEEQQKDNHNFLFMLSRTAGRKQDTIWETRKAINETLPPSSPPPPPPPPPPPINNIK